MEGAKDNKLLSMHRLSPTPFSSDEGAESGDDSEEDIVTNYLPGSAGAPLVGREGPATSSHHHHHHHHHQLLLFNQQQQPQPHQQQAQQKPKPQLTMQHQQQHHHHQQQQQPMVASVLPIHAHAHGPPRRLVRMAEIPTMDSITAESLGMGVSVGPADAFIPPIPTISITPHSPIAHKPFTVLDENIRQLQGIQATIQRMRETNLTVKVSVALSGLVRAAVTCSGGPLTCRGVLVKSAFCLHPLQESCDVCFCL
ncbi:mastermind-like domain-containing protein 1 [Eriocheir sinensis]|uniref:mastermind-like domain-containing protein 1 n=1 Tax=Eriocheir sinensis TaxID=95602 RepID=UPI0021C689DC|nr:mastermind-like domain-containing protein 1 [Eriocheir sinensis]